MMPTRCSGLPVCSGTAAPHLHAPLHQNPGPQSRQDGFAATEPATTTSTPKPGLTPSFERGSKSAANAGTSTANNPLPTPAASPSRRQSRTRVLTPVTDTDPAPALAAVRERRRVTARRNLAMFANRKGLTMPTTDHQPATERTDR